jgi:hypothetical protein
MEGDGVMKMGTVGSTRELLEGIEARGTAWPSLDEKWKAKHRGQMRKWSAACHRAAMAGDRQEAVRLGLQVADMIESGVPIEVGTTWAEDGRYFSLGGGHTTDRPRWAIFTATRIGKRGVVYGKKIYASGGRLTKEKRLRGG